MTHHSCRSDGCGRQFLSVDLLQDHADAVHTFDDIRRAVQDAVRDKFGSQGTVGPNEPRVYVWVADLAEDWVVFELDVTGGDTSLQKASYTILDGNVTLGEPVEVTRRTVYEPVNSSSSTSSLRTVTGSV